MLYYVPSVNYPQPMQKYLFILLLLILSCDEVVAPDTTAPTVVITYPVNETTLTATTIVKVDVSDNGEIKSVTFMIDGSQTYADSTAPYEYEWDVCILGTGSHSVLVKAEDSAGNIGQCELYSFTINASYDCAEVCGGASLLDNCDICDTDAANDCGVDCNGVWGGDALEDDCGICDNNFSNDNTPLTGTCDCAATPEGAATIDNCNTCVDGTTGLTACIEDGCGVWGGDSSTCTRCRVVHTYTSTYYNDSTDYVCHDNITQEECDIYYQEIACNSGQTPNHQDYTDCNNTDVFFEQGSCDAYCLDNYCEDSATNILYVLYEISVPISGFQFNVVSLDTSTVLIADILGGLAVESGLSISTSPNSVLGFSLSGNSIPAGSGTLLVLQIEGSIHNACLSNPVLSNSSGEQIPTFIDNCNIIKESN